MAQKASRIWRIVGMIGLFITAIIIIYIFTKNDDSKLMTFDDPEPVAIQTVSGENFTDGLQNPSDVRHFKTDEAGFGITEIAVYTYDINNDGRPDKITRTRTDNGTVHFQYAYKIELNDDGTYIDITPRDFYTIEGAECAHQKLQFSFRPDFSVTKISRPMGDDWNTPTQSTKTVFSLWGNQMHIVTNIEYKTACDVSELY